MKSFKTLLFSIFAITLISLGFFVLVLFNIDPIKSDFFTKAIFFTTLFILVMGILTLIGFYFRVAKSNNEVLYANFYTSLRQSILFSLILIILLVMRSGKLLNWWDTITVALAIFLFELYFQTRPNKKYSINQQNNE